MAIQKNFKIANGLEVNDNLIFADKDQNTVGIGTTVTQEKLQVIGGIGATDLVLSGVGTIPVLKSTDALISNGYINVGVVTSITGTGLTYTTGNLGTLEAATGNIVTGVVTTVSGTNLTYTNGNITVLNSGTVLTPNLYAVSGIVTNGTVTNLTGVAATITGVSGNVKIGTGTTALVVEGDTRVTGILTVGTSSLTLNGETNQINGVTISSGIVTATTFSGDLSLSDGSASAPSIKFSSSTTTGIYSPGTNQFAITTNGVGRITIDASGNIVAGGTLTAGSFIPTSSTVPTNGLYSPGTDQLALSTNGTGRLFVDANGQIAAGASLDASISVDTRVLKIGGLNYLTGTNGTSGKQNFKTGLFYNALPTSSANANAIVSNAGSDYLPARYTMFQGTHIWETATSATAGSAITWFERMRVTNAGLVGIGTSAPSELLHLKGAEGTAYSSSGATAAPSGGIKTTLENTSGWTGVSFAPVTSGSYRLGYLAAFDDGSGNLGATIAFGRRTASGYSESLRINSLGRVGIGTTSPASTLDVNGDVTITDKIIHSGDTNTAIRFPANDTVSIETAGSERARIDSSGRLLVGTSTSVATATGQGEAQFFGTQGVHIRRAVNSSAGPQIAFGKTRATTDTTGTIVQSGDILGTIQFAGDDGTDLLSIGAQIKAEVDGTPSTNDMPGRLVFSTTASGASSTTERMRITSTGTLLLGATRQYNTYGYGTGENPTYGTILQSDDGLILSRSSSVAGGESRLYFGGAAAQGAVYQYPLGYIAGVQEQQGDTTNSATRIGYLKFATFNGNLGFSERMRIDSAGTTTLTSSTSTAPFIAKINTSEVARIDSSGRLLVGTSSARSNYDTSLAPHVQIESTSVNGTRLGIVRNAASAGSGSIFLGKTRSAANGGNDVVLSGDGLGGIDFYGADGTNLIRAASIAALVDGTPGANDMPGRLVFSTTADGASSPTERMRITSGGSLINFGATFGIGSRSASAAGTVNWLFAGNHSATNTGSGIGTNVYLVYTNGNVVNTNNSYGAISDIKLKENIVDANSQWSDVKALQVRKYNFKEGQTHTQLGLIAQEVELVSPGLVSESPDRDEDGNDLGTVTKSVNYSVLYMKAVKALQEAMERIETLEAKVAALESA